MDRLQDEASPEDIVRAAIATHSRSIAYTYNDPVIFLEYAVDVAKVAREHGIKNVAVTAGYIGSGAREELFRWMDAANVDLKAFTEEFYKRLCTGHLGAVLETLGARDEGLVRDHHPPHPWAQRQREGSQKAK